MRYLSDKGANIANAKAAQDEPSLRDIVFEEMADLIANHPDEVNYALNSAGVTVGESEDPHVLVGAIYENAKKNPQLIKNISFLLVRQNGIEPHQNDFGSIMGGVMDAAKGITSSVSSAIASKNDPGGKTRNKLMDMIAEKQAAKVEAQKEAAKGKNKIVIVALVGTFAVAAVITGIYFYQTSKSKSSSPAGAAPAGSAAPAA